MTIPQTRLTLPLPCFICGRELESALSPPLKEAGNQPTEATIFSSRGNYGSTMYDPIILDEFLEINICDKCLQERIQRVARAELVPIPQKYRYQQWRPDDDQC